MQEGALSADRLAARREDQGGAEGPAFVADRQRAAAAERNALDNDPKTRWTTGAAMRGGEWFMVDLGYEGEIRTKSTSTPGPTGNDDRAATRSSVSLDGEQWGAPVGKGNPQAREFTITLPPTTGRFVKIVQTGNGRLVLVHQRDPRQRRAGSEALSAA
jgi:hypothetical protein